MKLFIILKLQINKKGKIMSVILFDGHCPICKKDGNYIEMKVNDYDFFECPSCNCQIVIQMEGATAILFKKLGNGSFRNTQPQSLTRRNEELIIAQDADHYPFALGTRVFNNINDMIASIEDWDN